MSQHILIELAKRKPYLTSPEMPKDAVFDSAKGYWLSGSNPLVSPGSKYGALVSKNAIRKQVRIKRENDSRCPHSI